MVRRLTDLFNPFRRPFRQVLPELLPAPPDAWRSNQEPEDEYTQNVQRAQARWDRFRRQPKAATTAPPQPQEPIEVKGVAEATPLDPVTARKILSLAGGNQAEADRMAAELGYTKEPAVQGYPAQSPVQAAFTGSVADLVPDVLSVNPQPGGQEYRGSVADLVPPILDVETEAGRGPVASGLMSSLSQDLAGTPDLSAGVSAPPQETAPGLPYSPTPTPPQYEQLPSERPTTIKGAFKRGLMGMIPGYNEGYEAARARAERQARERNAFRLKIYSDQLAAQRNENMQIWHQAQLQAQYQRLENDMQKAIMANAAKQEANRIKDMADLKRYTDRYNFALGLIPKLDPTLLQPGREEDRNKFILSIIDPDLRHLFDETKPGTFELKLRSTNKALQEIGAQALGGEEIKRMAGAAPPAGAEGRTTVTTGMEWVQDANTGEWLQKPTRRVSQSVPGLQEPPAPPAPTEPISLKAVPKGTVPTAEDERRIRSLAAQTKQDPEQIREELGYAPFPKRELLPKDVAKQQDRQMLTIYQPAVDADQRLSIMQKDAADPSGQSDISLLFNHIGMTLGAQKGARITEAEIKRAIEARSIPEGLLARWDAVSKGQFLTPRQREEMVKLGVNMRREQWSKARGQARQVGITREPPQHPDLQPVDTAPTGVSSGKAYPRSIVQKYADDQKISYEEAKRLFEAKGHKVID